MYKSESGFSVIRLLVGLLVLAAGIGIAFYVIKSAPKPQRVKPEVKARLVEVEQIGAEQRLPGWVAGGEVVALDQVKLVAEVAGPVISVNGDAYPGAFLKKGTELARVDPESFEFVVAQRKASLMQAEAALELEQGQSALAAEEFELSGSQLEGEERALVLRKPQLKSAEAAVASARAALAMARSDLASTRVRMPFDGQVISRSVAVGTRVGTSTQLFEVMGTDSFQIEVKVPRSFITWLDTDSVARVTHPSWGGDSREARILDVIASVDSQDRQTRISLEIEQPLVSNNGLPPVYANDFVTVELLGKAIPDSVAIPLRQLELVTSEKGESWQVWVVAGNELQRRALEVVYRGREFAWIRAGFESGDRLLLSRVDGATNGLPVRVEGESSVSSAAGADE